MEEEEEKEEEEEEEDEEEEEEEEDHLLSKQLMRNWEHVQLFQICVLPHAQ